MKKSIFTSLKSLFNPNRMYENLLPDAFAEAMAADPNAVVLDVRTKAEFDEGHLPNAVHMDIFSSNFPHRVTTLDKSKSYYVTCRSGNRSGQACQFMAQQGFDKVVNLRGGVMAWGASRKPLTR